MKSCDVLILGGGIAGSAVAYNLQLINPEIKVVIVDPLDYGELEVSVVTYMEHLNYYNLLGSIVKTYTTQRYMTTSRIGYDTKESFPTFALIDYGNACKTLQESSEAEVLRDAYVDRDLDVITLKSGLKIRSKIVVDTMGLNSPLRKKMKLDSPPRRTALMFRRYRVNQLQDDQLDAFYYVVGNGIGKSYTSNGGWIYPISEEVVEVGSAFFLDESHPENRIGPELYNNLFESLDEITSSFFDYAIAMEEPPKTRITAYSPTKVVAKENVVFLGDVAGTGDPFLCANCSRYLDMSEYMALSINEAILTQDLGKLKLYQESWDYELKRYVRNRYMRTKVLFKKDLRQWEDILLSKTMKNSTETIQKRMGKLGYSLKYTLKRYPVRDAMKMLVGSVVFLMKYKVVRASPVFSDDLTRLKVRQVAASRALAPEVMFDGY